MTPLRTRMLEDLQIRNYSPNTVAAYIRRVAEFAKHFGKSPELLGSEQIREYQLYLIKEKGVSLPSYIQAVCALRFLYSNTLHLPVSIDRIPLPRYEKKLPVILSPAEVKLLLETPKNLSHRAMLTTMYAAGPRISEVAKLKVADIDSKRNVIWIRGGKGRKDRQVLLPPRLLELLRAYFRWKKPTEWLFPGQKAGRKPISCGSIFRACQKAARKAGIVQGLFIRTLFDTPSPRTCWNLASISAPFRSCSATQIWRPPPAICTSAILRCARPPVHWSSWTRSTWFRLPPTFRADR